MTTRRKLKVLYPWRDVPIAGSFFVPTLSPDEIIREGLRAAIGAGVIADKPRVGVQNGRYGVLFRRKR